MYVSGRVGLKAAKMDQSSHGVRNKVRNNYAHLS